MAAIRFKPDSLPAAAWGTGTLYDPLEVIVR
jgi:8-oxo-dGTP diphosphatase